MFNFLNRDFLKAKPDKIKKQSVIYDYMQVTMSTKEFSEVILFLEQVKSDFLRKFLHNSRKRKNTVTVTLTKLEAEFICHILEKINTQEVK